MTTDPSPPPRFAILEHTGAPDDATGRHFDLLVETGAACRTWRLMELPVADAGPVAALELPPHRLVWLERLEGAVSGGRGHARRLDAGGYRILSGDASDPAAATLLVLEIAGSILAGRLRLESVADGWAATLSRA